MTDETELESVEPKAPAKESAALGSAYSKDLVAEATKACAAAQRSVCNLPTKLGPKLEQALRRRVELTLADSDGKAIKRRLGGGDPEVRRLEAPYSKRRASERAASQTPGGRRRRNNSSGTTMKRK